jgi:putative acetyltransferase
MIEIKNYHPDFSKEIADLFYLSVHSIDPNIYTKAEQEAWAPPINYSIWKNRLIKNRPLVAFIEDKIVGFIEFENDGHIHCTYVHPDYQRQGVAQKLYLALEAEALRRRFTRLYVEASKLAKNFFSKQGFAVLRENHIPIRGQVITNFSMEKIF